MTNTDNTAATETAANTDLSNLTDAGRKVITDAASTTVTSSIGTLSKDGNYIKAADSVSTNLSTLDTQIKSNVDNIKKNTNAISAETTARETADTSLTNKIGTLDANGNYIQKDASVSSNLSTLDTQVKTNADAISKETTDRENAVTNVNNNVNSLSDSSVKYDADSSKAKVTLAGADGTTITNVKDGALGDSSTDAVTGKQLYAEQTARANTDTDLDNRITSNTIAITNLKALSNITPAGENVIKKQAKKAVKVAATGNATVTTTESADDGSTLTYTINVTHDGEIKTGDTNLVSGGTMYAELRPASDGIYVKSGSTTATNLLALDTNLKNVIDAIGLDTDDTTTSYTSKLNKYFKVNPKETTSDDGKTKTYAPDAAANGTNSVAIGPSAQAGEKTTDTTTSTATVTGGESSAAIGNSAKANGNTSVALGANAQVLNTTDQYGKTTATITGSTAIGSGAKVNGATDATAIGTSAQVNETAAGGIAFGKGAVTGEDKGTVTVGDVTANVAAVGGENSVALGTDAKASGNTALALGKGAQVNNYTTQSGTTVTKTVNSGSTAIGSGTSVSGKSIAIGYSSDGVTTGSANTNAIAIGNGAQANSNDSVSIGNQAGKGTSQWRNSGYGSLIAIGTNAGANVRGMQNVAMGSGAGSNVKSSYNVAIGSNAGSGINNAGDDNNPQNGYNVSIGFGANYNKDNSNQQITESIAVGREANAASNATAIGYEATANDVRSIAIGYNTTAGHKATGTTSSDVDAGSIAIGDSAKAMGGNIAIGTSSTAPATATLGTVGDGGYIYKTTTTTGTDESTTTTSVLKSPFTNKSLLATSTYVSVGDASNSSTRRISNVADGVFDSDAATVGQLNALNTSLVATTSNLADAEKYFDERFTTLNDNIDKIKYKYFSVSTDADTLTANQNNDGASTTSPDAMAIGPNAKASSAKAVAIGNNVSASGKGSIALGTADNPATSVTVKEGKNISANPHVTSAEGANSVAIGTSAIAQTDNSVALGTRASVYTSDVIDKNTNNTVKVGQRSIAIGYESETRNSDATSIGSGAKAYSTGSTAVGHGAFAQGADSVVLGTSSTANGASSGIVGKSNTINGSNTYAVGSENNVNGNWGAVTYSGLYGSKNIVNPVSDTSGNTKHGMDSLSVTGNSNTISQGSYSDTVQNISILGNSNSVTGASTDEANAGTTANITVIGGNNEVTGRDGAESDDMGKTWNQLTRTTVIGYKNTVNQAASTTSTSLADTQILGNDVTATLGNSVYLGTGSSAKNANSPDTDTLKKAETDAANAVDTTGMTDDQKTTALSDAKAQALYAVKLAAMKANNGSTAGMEALNTDTTYDDGTSYTYAGSSPVGVVTVGSAGGERRIQNVAAGLVSASSTDAVNGSQLYALTRQIRFGGDNSSFGKTTAAEDQNVVARGSNETISITGGSDAVTSSTADGTTTYTVDAAKLTGNNIAVVADKDANALHVQLASNLKDLNTAQLGSGSGESYKETIKLDGTGTTGGQVTLAGADGTVKTTLDTTGLTITNGPKFTSSGIDAASQQIKNVTTGTDNTDAANVGQVKSARTLLTQGTNTTLGDVEADGHHTYTVNVDNLAVKAATGNASVALAKGINFTNGTNTTSAVDSNGNVTIDTKNLTLKANGTNTASVTMDGGINFKDGTNTTAAVDNNGTVTINATHNKLRTVSAAPTGTKDDVTLTLTDADGNTVTSTGLKNTYTTVTKNGTAHTVTFARNDGTTQTVSLGDLDGASTEALNEAAAKATSEVTNGTNVASVTKTAGNNGQNIYTVTVDDLAVKTTSGEKKSVHLADGLVFADGDNTTATVGDNGTIKFNVSNDAIKKQAVQAIDVKGGSNVTVTPATNEDGTLKTFTVAASDLKYSANGTSKTTSLANGISFAAGTNTTAEIDANGAIKINATHNKLNPTGSATKATSDSNAVTLTLQDADGNTTTTGLTDTYTTVSKDATTKKVTFKRNDGETQTLDLSDLGGITAAQDKYITGGTVTYEANGNGTAALTGTNGITASITGLKDTKVSSGTASYTDAQGNATVNGSATLTMNDGSTATISGLKDDYITSASVGTENNHVTMTRLGGGTVDLNLNPILEKYSLSDYRLVGNGDTQDQAYQVSADGTVTLNVVDAKNAANKKTIQITGLASQSGVNAGRTTVKSSDSSVIVNDGTSNSDTHTYDIKVDYSKIPGHVSLIYTGDTGSGSNTLDHAVKFAGTANQVTTTATNGQVTFALASDIKGINSVTAGNTVLNDNGVSHGNMSLTDAGLTIANTDVSKQVSVTTSGISMGSQRIQNVADAASDTDAATLKQVKNARTKVAAGNNVAGVGSSEDTATHQTTYTVNVDNLAVKANDGTAKEVALKTGLNFKDGTNTTAVVGDDGDVKYDLNPDLTGLTSITTGNSTLNTDGLIIKDGTSDKVVIKGNTVTMGDNVIHNVGAGVAPTDAVNKGQLEALQTQVSGGWNLSGNNAEGTAVTAQIGAGKTVTYGNGNYTKAVVTKDDTTGNATVNVDVTTGAFGSGTGDKAGTVTATANGLATTGDVANAINSASISVVADNTPDNKISVKAGDTIHFAKDGNLTLVQNGTTFTYGLNPEISISKVTTSDATKGSTVQTAEGITTKDAAGNTYEQTANGITLTPKTSGTGKTAVSLTNTGLNNGNNVISGVGAGTADTDAVNVSQLKEVQNQVGSGWQIAGNDGTKVADIGAGKKVAFKSNSRYLMTSTAAAASGETDTGADVTYSLKTKELASGTNGAVASVSDADDGLVTAKNVAETINQTYWTAASGKSGSGSQTDETANAGDKQISAGDTVTFNAGNNLSLVQTGASFTYGLQTDLTGMNTIRFGGTLNNGSWSGGLLIGNQAGSGANTAEGNYITGLSNTKWDRATISENSNMAATEGQLKQAIENITKSGDGTGGFGLTADSGEAIMQDLRKTIQIKGDGEGTADGNITTSNESGVLRIRLNKKLDLTDQGSVTIGSSKVSDGSIVLGNTDATKKIALNSNEGTASIGSVTVNGTAKTVSGLSNTEWNVETAAANGYTDSNKAATESQLQTVYNQATKTASENELHTLAKEGGYTVDDNHKVSMDVVNGKGEKQGSIVINDVAKASEVGTVSEIADDLKKKNGDTVQPTSVVEAINNLNDKVGDKKYSTVQGKEIADGDSATTAIGKLNNRMNDIYTTAGQHASVSKADDNLTISENKNASGGTDYKISLNKEQIDLGNVIIKGNEGSISAKSMTSDSFTAGDTVVNKDGIKVGDKSALTSDSLKVNGKTYISSDGINANSQKITNVQTGTADTDAANVGQMREADAQLADAIQQTDAGLNEVGRAVNKLGNRLNRVGAGAAALAALHPGTYDPNDKWDFSAGIGHYHDANAVAIGAYYHPNDTTILSIGGSMGGGENMVNAGITWKMGRSGREQAAQPVVVRKVEAAPVVQQAAPVRPAPVVTPAPVTTPAPVKSVASATPVQALPAVTTPMMQTTTGDTAALAQILARQTAILEKLAQNQSQAAPSAAVAHGDDIFPDVPDNHWAYAYVAKLEKAGALKGFKRPAVLKSPMMTRDDFASVLYTAMANGATTNPSLNGDDSLNRLAQEFKAELKNVKV